MNSADRKELSDLMNRVSVGDRSAIDPLFESLRPVVEKFSRKILASNIEAEDVTQQVLLKVFENSSDFIIGSDVLSWVFAITAFECKTARKKTARRKEESLAGDFQITGSVEDSFINAQLENALKEMINELPLNDRVAILASINEALKPDIPNATYRKRLERGMTRLKQAWRLKHE